MKRKSILLVGLLVAAAFLSYGNVWSFAFLYDDEFLIEKNTFLLGFDTFFEIFQRSSTGGAGFTDSFYRPMQIVAYLLMRQLFGPEASTYHLLNVGLHALNAALIFVFARRLGLSRLGAFLPALLWVVHPVHTEAITYKSGTADPLSTVFILLALIALTHGSSLKTLAIAAVGFALAISSKEAAIVFPGLVMTLFFLTSDEHWKWRTYLPSLVFWLMAFGYLGLRATVLNFDGDFTMYKLENEYSKSVWLRLLTFLSTLPDYLRLFVWPFDLHIDRDYPVARSLWDVKPLLGLTMLAVPFACFVRALVRRERSWPWVPWMALWFMAAYGPSSGILIPVNALFLEHWMYLPSIALFIGLGFLIQNLATTRTRSRLAIASVVIVSGALAYRTLDQNLVWESPISLYTHILKYNPSAGRVRHNLAMALDEAGRTEEALREYQFIIDNGGKFPQTFHNLGQIHLRAGRLDLAERYELKAIELAPRFHPPYVGLSKIYEARGDSKKAQEYYMKAVELVK